MLPTPILMQSQLEAISYLIRPNKNCNCMDREILLYLLCNLARGKAKAVKYLFLLTHEVALHKNKNINAKQPLPLDHKVTGFSHQGSFSEIDMSLVYRPQSVARWQ